MIAAIDIGNTYSKVGLFDKMTLFSSEFHKNTDDLVSRLIALNPSAIYMSSVVKQTPQHIAEKISDTNLPKPYVLSIDDIKDIQITYKTPHTLGIDRLCGLEGALFLSHEQDRNTPLVTIDSGTATTVNILSPEKHFIGGMILPGIHTMIHSLHNKTSQLPEIQISEKTGQIGDDTVSSIASGIINAQVGAIEHGLKYVRGKFSEEPKCFLTGGNALFLKDHLSEDITFEPALVLYGIAKIGNATK